MILYQFTVPGKPVGYYAQGKYPNWKRKTEYTNYKRLVQQYALAIGIPGGRLQASRDAPLLIHTRAYFASGVHCDSENAHKGIVDSLFYKQPGGDRWVGGSFLPPLYDKDNPRVEVTIERCEGVG